MVAGYEDSAELGVKAFGGLLNVRPMYQREFVYNPQQRDAVIRTVRKGFPLNVMYWVKNGEGGFEMLDGQQRTISICRYVAGDYSIDHQTFANLTEEEREDIRKGRFRLIFGVGNLTGIVIGSMLILLLLVLLFNMINFVTTDISRSFTLFQTKF